ncbi:hypothetical protein EV360DRAFT_89487 [Lentinula raphanica]|nr:hypothetical protein EV360DRAFT_89487 [Lentinula raphanica]
MASKSQSSESLKQKSLMSFFGQPQQSTPSSQVKKSKPAKETQTNSKPKPKPNLKDASSDSPMQTPATKKIHSRVLNSSLAASSSFYGSDIKDTPPTSDAIDVDMMESEESASVLWAAGWLFPLSYKVLPSSCCHTSSRIQRYSAGSKTV